MSQALFLQQPLDSIILHRAERHRLRYKSIIVLVGSLILAISAHLSINLQPVPITLQTFAILFLSMITGWRIGASIVIAYLIEGASGLPVFAPGAQGISAFFGPSGGYLVGFLPAAICAGMLTEYGWGRHAWSTAFAAAIGTLIIYGYGIFWLRQFADTNQAFLMGVKPFLLVDALKVVALATLVPFFWRPRRN